MATDTMDKQAYAAEEATKTKQWEKDNPPGVFYNSSNTKTNSAEVLAADKAKKDAWLKRKTDWEKDHPGEKFIEPEPLPTPPKETFLIVNDINPELFNQKYDLLYPFGDLEVGQGFFVPNKPAETTVKNLERMHKVIVEANEFYAEAEVDALGDEIWESVMVKSRQRNADGTFKLTSDGLFIESADKLNRPKLIYSRHFMAYAILKDYELSKDNKAKEDGVLVVRVD